MAGGQPRSDRSRRRLPLLLLLVVSAVALAGTAAAQETPTVRTPPPQQMEPRGDRPAKETGGETERYTLSHERYRKAVTYSRAGYALYFLSVLVGFAVLLTALRTGFVGRLRDLA